MTNSRRSDFQSEFNAVFIIHIPPLRERPEDIPLLIRTFLDRFARENGALPKHISPEALKQFIVYDWPGNVRELKNITERLAVIAQDQTIQVSDLPPEIRTPGILKEDPSDMDLNAFTEKSLEQVERMFILHTLKQHKDNRTRAARALGISLRTLQRKLKEYGIYTDE